MHSGPRGPGAMREGAGNGDREVEMMRLDARRP